MLALSDLKTFIRSGGFAWPGGYPCALLMSDGESIDAKSAREYVRASCLGADLGEFRSLHAAKIAITRDRREYLAKRAADHHKAVQAIWGKK